MLNSVEEAISDIRAGRMVIVVDADDRESEGDFICAASQCMAESINFMATHGRGLICTAITAERVEELGLPMMASNNRSHYETAFTVSVEAREGTTTGISAAERALTSRRLADPRYGAKDFVSPGHTFPLRARVGGVLERAGHTEAAVDLARMAGLEPAGVLCEIMNPDGTMARMAELKVLAKHHGLSIIAVDDLIAYRKTKEKLVERVAAPRIPNRFGDFVAMAYRNKLDNTEHVAFVKGEVQRDIPCNVRVHSECLTGDVFGSRRCDCGEQLEWAMRFISENGGIFLYMRGQEGRGIGLGNKMRAYELQQTGLDTVEANLHLGFKADARSYGIGAQILADVGVGKMRLLTNNPRKIEGLLGYGLEIVERIPIEIPSHQHNASYMKAKREKMDHILTQTFEDSHERAKN